MPDASCHRRATAPRSTRATPPPFSPGISHSFTAWPIGERKVDYEPPGWHTESAQSSDRSSNTRRQPQPQFDGIRPRRNGAAHQHGPHCRTEKRKVGVTSSSVSD
jgi:hypothetical protein